MNLNATTDAAKKATLAIAKISTLYFPDLELAYINNPKAGCTTLKRSFTGNTDLSEKEFHNWVHANFGVQQAQAEELKHKAVPVIFVARNPIARALSGFNNKLLSPWTQKKRKLKRQILLWMDRSPDDTLTLDEFIDYMHSSILFSKYPINAHFDLQSANMRRSSLEASHIFKLEDLDDAWPAINQLTARKVELAPRANVTTKDGYKPRDLTEAQRAKLEETFAEDIKRFGY